MTPEQLTQMGIAGITVAILLIILKALWDEFKLLLARTLDGKDYELSTLKIERDRLRAQLEGLTAGSGTQPGPLRANEQTDIAIRRVAIERPERPEQRASLTTVAA